MMSSKTIHNLCNPEIVRLLIHYKPAKAHLDAALETIIKEFKGVYKINPETEKWMKGRASLQRMPDEWNKIINDTIKKIQKTGVST